MKSMAEGRRLLAEIKALRTENERLHMGLRHVRNVHASITGMRELFPEHTELGAIQGQLEIAFEFAGLEK